LSAHLVGPGLRHGLVCKNPRKFADRQLRAPAAGRLEADEIEALNPKRRATVSTRDGSLRGTTHAPSGRPRRRGLL
jgi:hypothetical protein